MKIKQNFLTAAILLGFSGPVLANSLENLSSNAWAFEALRSLVERYGCIVGYPDRTFRGERALTRWEFAAGLNACLNTLERLIQEGVAVLKEDLDKIKRLVKEFETELAALGARVDNLENRVAFLENNQFSTTTKLTGEVVMALYGVATGEKNGGEGIPQVPAFGYRARLELNTSFTGKDLLYTRLATGNIADLADTTGTFASTLAFTQPDGNDLLVEVLNYSFPVTENIQLWLEATGGAKVGRFPLLVLAIPFILPPDKLDSVYRVIMGLCNSAPVILLGMLTILTRERVYLTVPILP